MKPEIRLIAAVACDARAPTRLAIGANNRMPWRLPADLREFKRLTFGAPVVMGRKTFDAIGKPLPGRANIVVSRRRDDFGAGVIAAPSLAAALAAGGESPHIWIIGGGEIYEAALPLAARIFLTEIDYAAVADAHFPDFDRRLWREVSRRPARAAFFVDGAESEIDFAFVEYRRA